MVRIIYLDQSHYKNSVLRNAIFGWRTSNLLSLGFTFVWYEMENIPGLIYH